MNDEASNSGFDPAAKDAAGEHIATDLDYNILRSIGRGAYGEVFMARDRTGAYRAVKVIFRESFDHQRPFEREYQGICKFEIVSRSNPNQIQIFKVGRRSEPEQFYYVMELADDQDTGRDIHPDTYVPKTLRSELRRRGRLPAAECVELGLGLARAMDNLHENGLIHRDIKPANIIFVNNQPRLADIGLVTDAEMSVSHVGTEGFIPPEGPGSARADIFSLGKVIYEMCTGKDRMDFPELPGNLQELPDRELLLELNAIVARACEPNARKRYSGARKLVDDFQYLQEGKSARARRTVRRRLAVGALSAAIVAACGLLFFVAEKVRRAIAVGPEIGHPPAPPAADESNLVVNGSFEWPVAPFSGKGVSPNILNAAYLLPWRTSAGNFEIWADGKVMPDKYVFHSADGQQNLEILSTTNQATVWQMVSTIPGVEYTFSFEHTPRPYVLSQLTVAINDTVVVGFTEDGIWLTNFHWQKFSTNFIASSTATRLSFSDFCPGGEPQGTHLDAVALVRATNNVGPLEK